MNHYEKHRWISLGTIGIEITSNCNLKCTGCDRSCSQAPSTEKMTVQQIQKFTKESQELNWKWKCISILGGEPTLHPDLLQILTLIHEAKIVQDLAIITNGYSQHVQEIIKTIPKHTRIQNTRKTTPDQNTFAHFNNAPKDNGHDPIHNNKCKLPWKCGIGLSRYGYYCCQPKKDLHTTNPQPQPHKNPPNQRHYHKSNSLRSPTSPHLLQNTTPQIPIMGPKMVRKRRITRNHNRPRTRTTAKNHRQTLQIPRPQPTNTTIPIKQTRKPIPR